MGERRRAGRHHDLDHRERRLRLLRRNFSNYNATYGSLGGVIVFLLWIWITNNALLFGAEFDAELERGRQLQAGIRAEEDIQLRARDTRQIEKQDEQHAKDVLEGIKIRESAGRTKD